MSRAIPFMLLGSNAKKSMETGGICTKVRRAYNCMREILISKDPPNRSKIVIF